MELTVVKARPLLSLLPQFLYLSSVANGVVSNDPLFALVASIVRVAQGTARFLCVDRTCSERIYQRVSFLSSKVEMLRIDARSVAARVVDNHSLWDRPVNREVARTGCSTRSLPEPESAVTISVERVLPRMARCVQRSILFDPLRVESKLLGSGEVIHDLTIPQDITLRRGTDRWRF